MLVDRSGGEERKAWPVRSQARTVQYDQSDSHLFRTAAQLDAEGFYPVEGNRWKKGEVLYLPLYEGKMVQAVRSSRRQRSPVEPGQHIQPSRPT